MSIRFALVDAFCFGLLPVYVTDLGLPGNANAPDLCWVRKPNVRVGVGSFAEQYLARDIGVAPVVKVIHEGLGIRHGVITTIHDVTNTQVIVDLPHKDLRRARSALMSLIPTTTGSAIRKEVFPARSFASTRSELRS